MNTKKTQQFLEGDASVGNSNAVGRKGSAAPQALRKPRKNWKYRRSKPCILTRGDWVLRCYQAGGRMMEECGGCKRNIYNPTRQEIRLATAKIRKGWSSEVRKNRKHQSGQSGHEITAWLPPVIHLVDCGIGSVREIQDD